MKIKLYEKYDVVPCCAAVLFQNLKMQISLGLSTEQCTRASGEHNQFLKQKQNKNKSKH